MASTTFNIAPVTGDAIAPTITLTEVNGTIQVDVSVAAGTGDLRGVFFHIKDDNIAGLGITGTNITATDLNGPVNGVLTVGSNSNTLTGGGQTGFDFGVEIGLPGIGSGDDFSSTTFTISRTGGLTLADFVNSNVTGDDIGVRIMSVLLSDGTRDGSSKLGGEIPAPVEPPPKEKGVGNSLGFWKTHADNGWKEYAVNSYQPINAFATVFGVPVVDFNTKLAGTQNTLLDALSAGGGGYNALARQSVAALLNADSDANPSSPINYIYTDNAAIESGLNAVYGIDLVTGVAKWTAADKAGIINTLKTIDLGADDGRISGSEVINAFKDAIGTVSGPLEISTVATALDVMNNMPHAF
jgi:hypothetical protein